MEFTIEQSLSSRDVSSLSKVNILRLLLDHDLIFMQHFAHPLIQDNSDKNYYLECFLPGYHLAIEFKTNYYYQNNDVRQYIDNKIERIQSNEQLNVVVIDLQKDTLESAISHINQRLMNLNKDSDLNQHSQFVRKQAQVAETVFDYYGILKKSDIFMQHGLPVNALYAGCVAIQAKSNIFPFITYDEFMDQFKFLLTSIHHYKSVKPKHIDYKTRMQMTDIDMSVFNMPQFRVFIESLIENDPFIKQYLHLMLKDTSVMYYNDKFNHHKKEMIEYKKEFKQLFEDHQLKRLKLIKQPKIAGLLIKDGLQELGQLPRGEVYASNRNMIEKYVEAAE